MKIVNVIPHAISVPLQTPFYFSQGWVHSRSSLIIEIQTDSGITGFGESLCHGLQSPLVSAAMIEHCLKPLLLGRSPFDVEVLWEEMYNLTRPYGQAGIAVNAISGVDIALWDIIGRALNKPIHSLIGGAFRTEITPYATGFYRTEGQSYPTDSVDEAHRYLESGFNAFKLKIGFGLKEDIALIEAVRESVGKEVTILADANGAYDLATARQLIKQTETLGIHLYEELLSPENMAGYKSLKSISTPLIAAGEQIFGKMGFHSWLSERALDVIQPDICSSGGITECKKIAALSQANHTQLIPHVWGSGVGIAASIQFLASLPSTPLSLNQVEPILEFDLSSHPFRKELIFDGIEIKQGKIQVSTKRGIGVDVNKEVIERFKVN